MGESGALNDPFVSRPTDYVTEAALNDTSLRGYPPNTLVVALYGEGKTRGKCSELLIEATTNQAIAAIVQRGRSGGPQRYIEMVPLRIRTIDIMGLNWHQSGADQPKVDF